MFFAECRIAYLNPLHATRTYATPKNYRSSKKFDLPIYPDKMTSLLSLKIIDGARKQFRRIKKSLLPKNRKEGFCFLQAKTARQLPRFFITGPDYIFKFLIFLSVIVKFATLLRCVVSIGVNFAAFVVFYRRIIPNKFVCEANHSGSFGTDMPRNDQRLRYA